MVIILNGKIWKESQLVVDYLWNNHRENLQWRRVRLGQLPSHELARMHMVNLRWADAIVYDDEADEILIIEAKLRPDAGALGQLQLYEKLFRETPEFELYRNKKIRLVFLCPTLDLNLAELATQKEIDYEIWPPLPEEAEE